MHRRQRENNVTSFYVCYYWRHQIPCVEGTCLCLQKIQMPAQLDCIIFSEGDFAGKIWNRKLWWSWYELSIDSPGTDGKTPVFISLKRSLPPPGSFSGVQKGEFRAILGGFGARILRGSSYLHVCPSKAACRDS